MPKVDKQQLAFDAVRRGNISEVKKAFGKKLSFGIINSSGQTPLHIACSEGHYLVVQWLTSDKKKFDIDAKDRDGWTPLHCACHSDHIEIVDHLIARNADVCKETSNGSSAMDYFVRMPSQSSRPALFERLFRTMIRKGVNVNKQNASLETPLHKAAFRGKDQSVSLLLWNQADPNIKNKYGETALHLATGASCINVVKKLIDAKADCTISGSRGNVFDIAKKSGNPDIVRLFESILGAPINSKTSPETTPTVQKTTPPQPNTQPTEPTQPTVSQPQTNVPSAYGAPKQPLVTRDDLNRHKPVGVTLEKQRSQTTVTPIPVNVPTYLQNTGDYSSWNIGSPTTGGKTGTNPTGATIGTSAYGAGQPTATGSFAPYTQPSGKYGSVGVTGYASLTSGYMTPPKEEAPTPTPNLTTQPSYLQFDNQPKKTAQPVTPTPVQPVTPVKEEPKPEPTPVIEEPKTEPIKHKKDTKRNTKRNTRKQEAPKTEPIKKKEPEKPKNLENYTLGDCIGTGAFGKVYRGLDCRTGALVAIKQVSLSGIPDSELASIMSELELLQKLEYKYIVQYIGFIRTDEHLNIITELIEGGSLSTIMKRFGKAQEPLCARYVAQTLLGLDYLHRRGVVHRDIKSGNILVTKDGIIKLADFGIAAVSDAQNADEKMATLRDVAKHKDQAPNTDAVGSPYWMAPEVIQMMGASSNSDIWSLGCTVIELLTGDPPYINLPPMSALFAMVSDSSPPLPDTISSELREFFGLCFKKDPKERPSARDLLTHPWIVNNVGDMSSELSGRATSGNSTPKPTKKTQPKREASPPPLEPPVVEAPKQPPTPVQPVTPTPVQPVQPVIQTPVQPVTPTPVQPPVQPVVQPNIQPNGNMPMQTPEEILKNLNAAFPGGNNAGMTLTGIPTLSNVMENLNMLQSAFAGAGITPHGVNPMANPMANPMMNPMMTQGNPYANIQMPSGREILAQPEVEKEESEESEEESEETMLENQYQKDARAIKEYMTWIKLAMKGGRGDRAASIRKALRKALKQIRIRHGKRQDARELAKDARALIREVEDTFPDNIGIDSSDSDYDSEDSFFLESDGEEDDIYF